jgi:hypothetical protein
MKSLEENFMKYFLVLALVVTGGFAQSHTNPAPEGEIRGSVTDQDGKPVSAAMVFALPQDLTLDSIAPRSAKTDKDGNLFFAGGSALERTCSIRENKKRVIRTPLTVFMRMQRKRRKSI